MIGGLAGILAGILIAPKSGRETRGGLSNRAGEARQRGSETYFDARERLRERIFVAPAPGSSSNDLTRTPSHGAPLSPEPDLRMPDIQEPDQPYRDVSTPAEPPPSGRGFLRDVSRGVEDEQAGLDEAGVENPPASGDRPDELRRKIRETRERLKSYDADPGESASDEPASGDEVSGDGGEDDPR